MIQTGWLFWCLRSSFMGVGFQPTWPHARQPFHWQIWAVGPTGTMAQRDREKACLQATILLILTQSLTRQGTSRNTVNSVNWVNLNWFLLSLAFGHFSGVQAQRDVAAAEKWWAFDVEETFSGLSSTFSSAGSATASPWRKKQMRCRWLLRLGQGQALSGTVERFHEVLLPMINRPLFDSINYPGFLNIIHQYQSGLAWN